MTNISAVDEMLKTRADVTWKLVLLVLVIVATSALVSAQKNEKPQKEKEQFLLVLPPEGAPVLPGNLTSILNAMNLRNKTTSAPIVCNTTSFGLASTGKRGWWNGLRKVYLRRRRRHAADAKSESSSEEDPDYGQEYEEVLVVEKRRIFKNNNHCLNSSDLKAINMTTYNAIVKNALDSTVLLGVISDSSGNASYAIVSNLNSSLSSSSTNNSQSSQNNNLSITSGGFSSGISWNSSTSNQYINKQESKSEGNLNVQNSSLSNTNLFTSSNKQESNNGASSNQDSGSSKTQFSNGSLSSFIKQESVNLGAFSNNQGISNSNKEWSSSLGNSSKKQESSNSVTNEQITGSLGSSNKQESSYSGASTRDQEKSNSNSKDSSTASSSSNKQESVSSSSSSSSRSSISSNKQESNTSVVSNNQNDVTISKNSDNKYESSGSINSSPNKDSSNFGGSSSKQESSGSSNKQESSESSNKQESNSSGSTSSNNSNKESSNINSSLNTTEIGNSLSIKTGHNNTGNGPSIHAISDTSTSNQLSSSNGNSNKHDSNIAGIPSTSDRPTYSATTSYNKNANQAGSSFINRDSGSGSLAAGNKGSGGIAEDGRDIEYENEPDSTTSKSVQQKSMSSSPTSSTVTIVWPKISITASFPTTAQSVVSSQNSNSYNTQMHSNMPSSSQNYQPTYQTSSHGSNSNWNSISSKSYNNPIPEWTYFTSSSNNPINDWQSTNLNGNTHQSNSPSSRWPWSSSSNFDSQKSSSNDWRTQYQNNKDWTWTTAQTFPSGLFNTNYNWWKSSSSLRPNGDEKMVGTTRRATGDGAMEDKDADQESNNSDDDEEQSTVSVTWSKSEPKSSVTWPRPGSTSHPDSRPFPPGPAKPLTCSNIVLTKLSAAVFTNLTLQKCYVKNKKLNPSGLTLSELMLGLGRDSQELRESANDAQKYAQCMIGCYMEEDKLGVGDAGKLAAFLKPQVSSELQPVVVEAAARCSRSMPKQALVRRRKDDCNPQPLNIWRCMKAAIGKKCGIYHGSDDGISDIGSSKDAGRWNNRGKGGGRGNGGKWNAGGGNNWNSGGGRQWNGGGKQNNGGGGDGKQNNGGGKWNNDSGHRKGHGHWHQNGGDSSSEDDDMENKIWIVGSKNERGIDEKRRALGNAWDFASNEEDNYEKEWMRHVFSLARECICKQKKPDGAPSGLPLPMPPLKGGPPAPPSKNGLDLKPKPPEIPQPGESGRLSGLPGRLGLNPFLVKKAEHRGSLKGRDDKNKPAASVVANKQSSITGKSNQQNKAGKPETAPKNSKQQVQKSAQKPVSNQKQPLKPQKG